MCNACNLFVSDLSLINMSAKESKRNFFDKREKEIFPWKKPRRVFTSGLSEEMSLSTSGLSDEDYEYALKRGSAGFPNMMRT